MNRIAHRNGIARFGPLIRTSLMSVIFPPAILSEVYKGLAVRGGCREEILPMPEIEASFLCLFFLCPLRRRGTHYWRTFRAVFGACLSPTPSRQPLFETSGSMAGMGCAKFLGTWNLLVLSAGKTPMPIKFSF